METSIEIMMRKNLSCALVRVFFHTRNAIDIWCKLCGFIGLQRQKNLEYLHCTILTTFRPVIQEIESPISAYGFIIWANTSYYTFVWIKWQPMKKGEQEWKRGSEGPERCLTNLLLVECWNWTDDTTWECYFTLFHKYSKERHWIAPNSNS